MRPEAKVTIADDELLIEWFCGSGSPRVVLSMDGDGKFEYAIRNTEGYVAGKFGTWPEAATEIRAAIANA